MVIQTERYPNGGGYQQESYTVYQGYGGGNPDGGYSNFPGLNTGHTAPHSTYPPFSSNPLGHAHHQQSGWTSGSNHYSRPAPGGYGNYYYENSPSHGGQHGYGSPPSRGSPHHYGSQPGYGSPHGYGSQPGHGSPHGYGSQPSHGDYGSPHKYGNSNSYGGGPTKLINKLTHGLNGYESAGPNYGYGHGGVNHGGQKPSWVLKGLDHE